MLQYNQLLSVFKDLPWPVVILDPMAPKYSIVQANDSFLKVLSLKEADVNGRPFLQVFPGEQCLELSGNNEDLHDALGQVVLTGKEQSLTGRCYLFSKKKPVGEGCISCWRPVFTPVTDSEGNVEFLVYSMSDITEQELDKQEKQHLALVASKTNDMVVIGDEHNNIKWVNKAFEKQTGYRLHEITGKQPDQFLSGPDTDAGTLKKIRKAITEKESIQTELLNYTKERTPFWVDITLDPVLDDNGRCRGFIAVEKNMTRYKAEEERLKLLESVVTHMNESVLIVRADEESPADKNEIIYVNDAYCRMSGYTRPEIMGRNTGFLAGDKTDNQSLEKIREALIAKKATKSEFLAYKKSGETFWVHLSLVPVVGHDGRCTHWISIERDVTDRKTQQQAMMESLHEKEILLSEIHHRVKNNLALISGMMQLQAEDENNQELCVKLLDSVARIKTIANIHEHIYKTDSFVRIDVSETISLLVESLLDTFQPDCIIEVNYECEEVYLNINQVLPCSLIVNEVITNALKHAFINKKEGRIMFKLKENNGVINLQIKDNGVGLPDDFNEKTCYNLGIHLVDTLSRQLKGDYAFETVDIGCLFTLQFIAEDKRGACDGMCLCQG